MSFVSTELTIVSTDRNPSKLHVYEYTRSNNFFEVGSRLEVLTVMVVFYTIDGKYSLSCTFIYACWGNPNPFWNVSSTKIQQGMIAYCLQ